jgi:hypothetical protein
MRGYSPNYGHYVAYARPPARLHRAAPSHKDRQVALRRPVAVAYTQWEKFIHAWQRMLDMPCRIEYFKMNEAKCAPAKPKGQFAGWSREKTDERVAIAYSTIEHHAHFQLSCIVDLEPFYRIFDERLLERRAINPFYLAFGRMITGFTHKQRGLGLQEKVDFIFDERSKEKTRIRDAWDAYKDSAEPDIKPYIGSDPRFENDIKCSPLQAADLNAWWIRKMATEKRQIYNFPWKARRQIPGVQFITMKNPTEDSGGAYFEVRCLGCAMATWKERRAWRRELKDNGVGL